MKERKPFDRVAWARKEFAPFPELAEDQNETIWLARSRGFARFYTVADQAQKTYNAAQQWLQDAPTDCAYCNIGAVHQHHVKGK